MRNAVPAVRDYLDGSVFSPASVAAAVRGQLLLHGSLLSLQLGLPPRICDYEQAKIDSLLRSPSDAVLSKVVVKKTQTIRRV